ncbi:MAG: amino acid racemase [Gammaproteobacteria bacterium]|nr:amino acid racemase [Gammaproteobacteria bacterium]
MKKIALVGGLGPEGTLEYYRDIISGFRNDYSELGYPEMVIESLNMKPMLALADSGNWQQIAQIIAEKFEAARRGGAEFGAIAANTPHKVFDEIQATTALPLISIVTATCDAVGERGLRKAGLLGTGFTMQSDFYFKEFANAGIELVVPARSDQQYMHAKLFAEIEHGIATPETRQGFLDIVNRLIRNNDLEGVVSACTEFPLVMQATDFSVDWFDTAAIHIASIVDRAKS